MRGGEVLALDSHQASHPLKRAEKKIMPMTDLWHSSPVLNGKATRGTCPTFRKGNSNEQQRQQWFWNIRPRV
jgi:hypothetical protein